MCFIWLLPYKYFSLLFSSFSLSLSFSSSNLNFSHAWYNRPGWMDATTTTTQVTYWTPQGAAILVHSSSMKSRQRLARDAFPALFMASLLKTARRNMAALTVVFFDGFQTSIKKQEQKQNRKTQQQQNRTRKWNRDYYKPAVCVFCVPFLSIGPVRPFRFGSPLTDSTPAFFFIGQLLIAFMYLPPFFLFFSSLSSLTLCL